MASFNGLDTFFDNESSESAIRSEIKPDYHLI